MAIWKVKTELSDAHDGQPLAPAGGDARAQPGGRNEVVSVKAVIGVVAVSAHEGAAALGQRTVADGRRIAGDPRHTVGQKRAGARNAEAERAIGEGVRKRDARRYMINIQYSGTDLLRDTQKRSNPK